MLLPVYYASLTKITADECMQPSTMRDKFEKWYGSLPLVSRNRRFSMSEFEAALKQPGRLISPTLIELGWRRKRVWSTTQQYNRYWEPPSSAG